MDSPVDELTFKPHGGSHIIVLLGSERVGDFHFTRAEGWKFRDAAGNFSEPFDDLNEAKAQLNISK